MKDSLIICFQTFHYLLQKKTCGFNECHKEQFKDVSVTLEIMQKYFDRSSRFCYILFNTENATI